MDHECKHWLTKNTNKKCHAHSDTLYALHTIMATLFNNHPYTVIFIIKCGSEEYKVLINQGLDNLGSTVLITCWPDESYSCIVN